MDKSNIFDLHRDEYLAQSCPEMVNASESEPDGHQGLCLAFRQLKVVLEIFLTKLGQTELCESF